MKPAVAMTVFCRTAKPEVWSLLVLVLSATTFSAPQEDLLYDGKMNPACVWEAETDTNGVMRPIPVVTDFGGMRTYPEEHDWDDRHVRRYVFAQNRRAAFAWLELNELRAERGLPPVPLTGFVANVDEPRKQNRWDE